MIEPDHYALLNWKTLEAEVTAMFRKANPSKDFLGRSSLQDIGDQMEIARWYKLIRKHTTIEPPTEHPHQEILNKYSDDELREAAKWAG